MTGIWLAMALLLLLVGGCDAGQREIRVPFGAVFGEQDLVCGAATDAGRLTDLRFFVSNIRLVDDDATPIDLQLTVDNRWQGPSVALIDLENGSGDCQNGTPAVHPVLTGRVPAGDYRGIRFEIGVPFDLNHGDPLVARPPLDDSTMHWHWRSGYKFLRAGFANDARNHWLHLGSAGCEGSIQTITHCRFPNRVTVMIDDYAPGDVLLVDLAVLFDAFAAMADRASSCSSGPAELACELAFAPLGLDPATGAQREAQRLVRRAK